MEHDLKHIHLDVCPQLDRHSAGEINQPDKQVAAQLLRPGKGSTYKAKYDLKENDHRHDRQNDRAQKLFQVIVNDS